MVTIKDGCGCDPCDCDWKQKLKEAYSRAIQSVNKIGDNDGSVYFPDGTGFVKLPLPRQSDVAQIKTNTQDIADLKVADDQLDSEIITLKASNQELAKSRVSNVVLMNGTTVGNVKARIELEDAPSIDSNDYNIQKPTSVELVQGSAPAMVKAQITLSDGTVLISDDFMFTTEAIGQDVYISSFVFKNGNVAGTISADIGLSNGSTLTANNFAVPTDPNVTSTISDLQTRMAAVESGSIGGLDELKAAVANLQTNKADVTNTEQIITNKRVDTEIVRYKYNATDAYGIQGTGRETDPFLITGKKTVAGKEVYVPIGKIAVLDSDGNPTNFTSGGEVWEEVDLNNWPTDWVEGDRIRLTVHPLKNTGNPASSWTSSLTSLSVSATSNIETVEGTVHNNEYTVIMMNSELLRSSSYICFNKAEILPASLLNSNNVVNLGRIAFNGTGTVVKTIEVNTSSINTYVLKVERIKI